MLKYSGYDMTRDTKDTGVYIELNSTFKVRKNFLYTDYSHHNVS